MTQDTHNGWTNYATWRVNLEIIDGMDWTTEIKEGNIYAEISELKEYLKSYVEEVVFDDAGGEDTAIEESLAHSYARVFLEDVNYKEIAQHIIEDYPNIIKK